MRRPLKYPRTQEQRLGDAAKRAGLTCGFKVVKNLHVKTRSGYRIGYQVRYRSGELYRGENYELSAQDVIDLCDRILASSRAIPLQEYEIAPRPPW